jgi:hypothetical protein
MNLLESQVLKNQCQGTQSTYTDDLMFTPGQDSINSQNDDIIEGSKYHVVVNQNVEKGTPDFEVS